jgi:outer membrane protein TolC
MVARLNAALNRPVEAPVAWPRVAPSRSVDLTDQELLLWMKSDNPELQGLDFEIARDELAVELASKEFRPNFMVGLDWVDVGQAVDPSLPGSGDDSWVAKVSVSVPIWRSKYRAGVEETTRRHGASLKRRDDAENVLAANLKLALFGFRDAERKIHLFQHTLVPLAEASLEVAQEAYMAGKEDFLSLIDAQRLLLEFQLNYERSLADREQRLAELEKLVGRPLGGRQ